MLTHNYTYQECLDISKRVSWLEDDVLADKNFDFSKRSSNSLPGWDEMVLERPREASLNDWATLLPIFCLRESSSSPP